MTGLRRSQLGGPAFDGVYLDEERTISLIGLDHQGIVFERVRCFTGRSAAWIKDVLVSQNRHTRCCVDGLWQGVCPVSRLPSPASSAGPEDVDQTRPDRLLRGVDARNGAGEDELSPGTGCDSLAFEDARRRPDMRPIMLEVVS